MRIQEPVEPESASRAHLRRLASAAFLGAGLVGALSLVDAALNPAPFEPFALRLARSWAEHPVRVGLAGALFAWAWRGEPRSPEADVEGPSALAPGAGPRKDPPEGLS
jgi:hypothetical protein